MLQHEFEGANELANSLIAGGADPQSEVYVMYCGPRVDDPRGAPQIYGLSHPCEPQAKPFARGRPRQYRLRDLANRKTATLAVGEGLERIPFLNADAQTIFQFGARLVVGVGEAVRNSMLRVPGSNDGPFWATKSINLWQAVVTALCHKRDTQGQALSVDLLKQHLMLDKVEALYLEGHEDSIRTGEWADGFTGVKAYLEAGLPAYRVEKLLAQRAGTLPDQDAAASQRMGFLDHARKSLWQDDMAREQHNYRAAALVPVLAHMAGMFDAPWARLRPGYSVYVETFSSESPNTAKQAQTIERAY
jgi:hypothetical protein